jgi:purine-binding chemotaxis protein CheW
MSVDIQDIQVASFRLGEDLFAVDIMRIKEIIRPQRLTHLPRAPQFIEGVINLRGTVIPVLDLRLRFDLSRRPEAGNSRLLIVRMGGQVMGLEVDDVTEVVTVPLKDVKPPPAVASCAIDEYLIGVCLVKDTMLMLLNLDKLLAPHEVTELGAIQ